MERDNEPISDTSADQASLSAVNRNGCSDEAPRAERDIKCEVCGVGESMGKFVSKVSYKAARSYHTCIFCLGNKAEPLIEFEITYKELGTSRVNTWVMESVSYLDGEYITYQQ